MPDEDKVELLLKLAEVSWRDYNERRSIEWKTNFALWLALGSFGGFIFQHPTDLPTWVAAFTSFLLACIFLVYVFLWRRGIQEGNRLDLDAAHYYWMQVDNALGTTSPQARTRSKDQKWQHTHLAQVFVTLLFVLIAILAVWMRK